MAKINENTLAKEIAALEGGKHNLSIAQVKEVLKMTFDLLSNQYKPSEVLATLESHKE